MRGSFASMTAAHPRGLYHRVMGIDGEAAFSEHGSSDYEAVHAALSESLRSLQAALREALETSLPSESGVRACGRALGVTRFLGWSCWNVAHAADVPAALHALPGTRGWTAILRGLESRGCPKPLLERLRSAIEKVARDLPAGRMNAALVRSMAAGTLDSAAELRRINRARRQARAAAEVIHGVRAKANVCAIVLTPSPRRGLIDIASFSVLEGVERLRPGPGWPIYQTSIFRRGSDGECDERRPLFEGSAPPLAEALSTRGAAEGCLRVRTESSRATFDFVAGPSARRSGARLVFGEIVPEAGDLGRESPRAELAMIFALPLRIAVFDLFVHRTLPRKSELATALYPPRDMMSAARFIDPGFDWFESMRLPMGEKATSPSEPSLPRSLRACHGVYEACLSRAFAASGTLRTEFEHHRVEMPDPPMHGSLVVRWLTRT